MALTRRRDTPESRKFWDGVDNATYEISKWPEWKRKLRGLSSLQTTDDRGYHSSGVQMSVRRPPKVEAPEDWWLAAIFALGFAFVLGFMAGVMSHAG